MIGFDENVYIWIDGCLDEKWCEKKNSKKILVKYLKCWWLIIVVILDGKM